MGLIKGYHLDKDLNEVRVYLEQTMGISRGKTFSERETKFFTQPSVKCETRIFFLKIFLMWTIFKVFIEFIIILLLFYVLVFWPQGMWDLSSLTRDHTCSSCIGRQSLNHWTAREVPKLGF